MRAFRVFWTALKDMYDELLLMLICNVLWLVISGPLLLFTYLALSTGATFFACVLALLAVLPLGPATAGLYSVAQRITEGRASSWRDFYAGMRRYAKPSWKVTGIWMIVLIVIVVDLIFYNSLHNTFGFVMIIFWLYALLLWFGALIYIFPLLLLQDEPNLKTLARNTFLMTLGRPLFTIITLILMLLVTGLTLLLPIVPLLIGVALLAQWGFRATLALIKDAEERRAALEAEKTKSQAVQEEGRRGQVRLK